MDDFFASLNDDPSVFDNGGMLDLDTPFMNFDTANSLQLPSASPPGSAQPFVDYLTAPASPEFMNATVDDDVGIIASSGVTVPSVSNPENTVDGASLNQSAQESPPASIHVTAAAQGLKSEEKGNPSAPSSALPADALAAVGASTMPSNQVSQSTGHFSPFHTSNEPSPRQRFSPAEQEMLNSPARQAAPHTRQGDESMQSVVQMPEVQVTSTHALAKDQAQLETDPPTELQVLSFQHSPLNLIAPPQSQKHPTPVEGSDISQKLQPDSNLGDRTIENALNAIQKMPLTSSGTHASVPPVGNSSTSNGGDLPSHTDANHGGDIAEEEPDSIAQFDDKMRLDMAIPIDNRIEHNLSSLFASSQPNSPTLPPNATSALSLSQDISGQVQPCSESLRPRTPESMRCTKSPPANSGTGDSAMMDDIALPSLSATSVVRARDAEKATLENSSPNGSRVANASLGSCSQVQTGTLQKVQSTDNLENTLSGEVPPSDENFAQGTEAAKIQPRRIEDKAISVVCTAWRSSSSPFTFVAAARAELCDGKDDSPNWQLRPDSEAALLNALFSRITAGVAASTRLLNYLRYALVSGLVSQPAVLVACLSSQASMTERVSHAVARLLAEMLPFFTFSADSRCLKAEADQFLDGLILILTCAAKSTSLMPTAIDLLLCDRVVVIARSALRRNSRKWKSVDHALDQIRASEALANRVKVLHSPQFALSTATASSLLLGRRRLCNGLCAGAATLHRIGAMMKGVEIAQVGCPMHNALQSAILVISRVFGSEIGKAFRLLWVQTEPPSGDVQLLTSIEQKAVSFPSAETFTKYSFSDKVRVSEAIVRYLAECAAVPGAVDQWRNRWGGIDRLSRMLRDALPQIKTFLRSEFSALMVAAAIVSSTAMCLGPALQLDDLNNGVLEESDEVARKRAELNEIVEDVLVELIGYAIGCLEEAAVADELPSWRSFGVWILLLASRCGCMLRASNCDPVRIANILQAWGGSVGFASSSHPVAAHNHSHATSSGQARSSGLPTMNGTGNVTGSHSAYGSVSNVGPSHTAGLTGVSGSSNTGTQNAPGAGHGSGYHHSSSSLASSNSSEGVAAFATFTTLAVIDAADTGGHDRSLQALSNDLML